MLRMCKPIFGTCKPVVLDSGFCVAKCITKIEAKCVYVCVLVSGMCIVPYGEVVRIFQPGFQTQAAATLFLYPGCLHAFFNPNDEFLCQ